MALITKTFDIATLPTTFYIVAESAQGIVHISIVATGMVGAPDVLFKRGNIRDETTMIVDATTVINADGNFEVLKTDFFAKFGAIKIDKKAATAGTLKVVTKTQ